MSTEEIAYFLAQNERKDSTTIETNNGIIDIVDSARIAVYQKQNSVQYVAFIGYEDFVKRGIEKLSKHGPTDLIMATPLKSDGDLNVFFDTLANLDLAGLRVGVIIGLDQDVDKAWRQELEDKIKQVKDRFVFCDYIETPSLGADFYTSLLRKYYFQVDRLHAIFENMGFDGANGNMIVFTVTRETMRLVMKRLTAKYILWLDADEQPPKDAIPRLLKHLHAEIVGMASGWALDRHWPFEWPKVKPAIDYEPETQQEIEWHKHAREFNKKLYEKIDALFDGMINSREETRFISPHRLWRETKLIEVTEVGFGCAMFKKELNDKCSFVQPPNVAVSEDYNFCYEARQAGYRLLVDPTVFCGHLGAKTIAI